MSKKKEQETEDHMLKLAEREEGRLKQEIDKIQRELDDLRDRQNGYEVLQQVFFASRHKRELFYVHFVFSSPGL